MDILRSAALLVFGWVAGCGMNASAQSPPSSGDGRALGSMNEVQLAMTLQAAIDATARKLPMTIDRFTTLTATGYEVKDRALVFRYDVSAEVDKDALKAYAVQANCASPRLAAAFERGIRARHVFATPGGVLEVPVAQADCKLAASAPLAPVPSRPRTKTPADGRDLSRI